MAPKRPTPPLDYPPSASSSDDEEVTSDDDVVTSDEEVEEEVPHAEEAEQEEEEEEEEEMSVNGAPAILVVMKKDEVSDFEMDDTESDDTTMNHLIGLVRKVASDFGISEEYLRSGLSLVEKTERVKMAKQWEKLLIDENELMLKRLELHMEMVKLVLDAHRAH